MTATRPKPIRVHEIRFTVEGEGGFPVDMLRHDTCYPADQASVRSIEVGRIRRQIHLISRTQTPDKPTRERWQSYRWTVVS